VVRLFETLEAKILVVDDQEANVLVFERMLRSAGYTSVHSTMDPRAVCDLHRENRYTLILLDLRMPDMDGFQVMEGLKEIDPDGCLPVLVVTAEPGQKLQAFRAGARDFVSKPLDLSEVLMRVHNMVEDGLLRAESKRLRDELREEQMASERLLLNVLPPFIVDRWKGLAERGTEGITETVADGFPEATVLLADIVGLAQLSASLNPHGLVGVLEEVFSGFDRIALNRGLESIKTMGDTYLAVAGLPVPTADHAARAAHMALDMVVAMDRFRARSGHELRVRVGINTGSGVAGVIGKRGFTYDVWGDAVSTARRMQSHGVVGRVQVAESTRRKLGEPFILEERGPFDLEGPDRVVTWFLSGRGADVIAPAAD
jgi:adenylate cyclase